MHFIWSINDDTSILLIFSCKTFSILTDISIDIYIDIDIDIDISHGQLDIYIFIDIDISHRHIYRYRYIPWTFCTWNRLIIKGTSNTWYRTNTIIHRSWNSIKFSPSEKQLWRHLSLIANLQVFMYKLKNVILVKKLMYVMYLFYHVIVCLCAKNDSVEINYMCL